MTHQLSQYRLRHGDVHLTVLPDGTEIPWRPLSIQEYLEYDSLIKSNQYAYAVLEDEIFKKCVTSRFFTVNIDELNAGVVSVVVTNILAFSGPQDIDDFNSTLAQARVIIQSPLHQVIELICRAFPAYKPEDVYGLDYATLMLRAALAEQRLLQLNLLPEPIILRPKEEFDRPTPEPAKNRPPQPKIEGPKLEKLKAKLADLAPRMDRVPQVEKKTVITTADHGEFIPTSGHEMLDYEVEKLKFEKEKLKALDGIEFIYGDYLKKLSEGKKLTPDDFIKSNSEKKTEYYQRMDDIKTGKLRPMVPKEPAGPAKRPKIKRR